MLRIETPDPPGSTPVTEQNSRDSVYLRSLEPLQGSECCYLRAWEHLRAWRACSIPPHWVSHSSRSIFAPTVKAPHRALSIFAAVSIKLVFKQFQSQQAVVTEVDTHENIWVTWNLLFLPIDTSNSPEFAISVKIIYGSGVHTASAFVLGYRGPWAAKLTDWFQGFFWPETPINKKEKRVTNNLIFFNFFIWPAESTRYELCVHWVDRPPGIPEVYLPQKTHGNYFSASHAGDWIDAASEKLRRLYFLSWLTYGSA